MSEEQGPARARDPDPDDQRPTFGVYELSQFAFCRRAGILARESPKDDEQDEGRRLRLDFLPRYDLANINALLRKLAYIFLGLLGVGGFAFVGVTLSLLVGYPRLSACLWIVLNLAILACMIDLYFIAKLALRRRKALGTPAREPLFDGNGAVPIDWWELRAAGFSPRTFQSVQKDESLGIHGRPFAVLIRKAQCIPVAKMHGKDRAPLTSHFVRIAGYCQLMDAATNFNTPFGILLRPKSLEAWAIPNTASLKEKLHATLKDATEVLAEPLPPKPPDNKNVCLNCPLGTPRRYVSGKTDTLVHGKAIPPVTVKVRGKHWHCPCGDRFVWHTPAVQVFAGVDDQP